MGKSSTVNSLEDGKLVPTIERTVDEQELKNMIKGDVLLPTLYSRPIVDFFARVTAGGVIELDAPLHVIILHAKGYAQPTMIPHGFHIEL